MDLFAFIRNVLVPIMNIRYLMMTLDSFQIIPNFQGDISAHYLKCCRKLQQFTKYDPLLL